MAQLFVILEWSLDPFLVRECDHKLNFIPLKHYSLLMIYMFHLSHFNVVSDFWPVDAYFYSVWQEVWWTLTCGF